MRIVSLNTYDILGGAARSAWRLHHGLRQLGHQCTLLCRVKASDDPDVQAISTAKPTCEGQLQRWASLADRLIHTNRTDRSGIFFTLPVPGYDLACHPAVQNADIIHLHWVYSLLAPEGVRRLLQLGKPVLWTLHDQRPFTGGCHFSFGCQGFVTDCAGCPELRDARAELTSWVLSDAIRTLDPSPITIVSPSQWLADCARRSTFFRRNRIEVIPYGLETNVFRPVDRAAARADLGLPADSFVLLFGADYASEKRKGFFVLEEALLKCMANPDFAAATKQGRVKLLSFGKGMEQGSAHGLPVQSLGYVSDDARLARIYSASDLLICPTLDDNLPNVVMEACACGTPVLGSRVGGVPELIRHGENGELFEAGNPRALGESLLRLWREPEQLKRLTQNSANSAGDGFGIDIQASRYNSLYRELLASKSAAVTVCPAPADPLPLCPEVWPTSYPMLGTAPPKSQDAPPPPAWRPPDMYYAPEQGNGWRPSWQQPHLFLSEAHEKIGKSSAAWRGWASENECRKIYEMAFYCGAVVLDACLGGPRTTLIALQAALAGGNASPQYFAVSRDRETLIEAEAAAVKAGWAGHCAWYQGEVGALLQELPIAPTMVLIDGEKTLWGSMCHLQTLRWTLGPGTPIFVHGYPANELVRHGVDDLLRTSHFEFMGLFADSVLLRTTGSCLGEPRALPRDLFEKVRDALRDALRSPAHRNGQGGRPVGELTLSLRSKLDHAVRSETGRGPWPYAPMAERPLPPTLPGGKPWPRISVVTPSFNQGQFLEQTILSVLNQGYPNLEYIVIDGASTDNSVAILRKYGPRLSYWESQKDRGQCHAINKGFARASGEILTWLNSDDMLAPGALASVAMGFHLSGADMVTGVCQLFEDGVLKNQHLTSCTDGPLPLDQLLDQENCWEQGQFFYQPEVFFTRGLWDRAGGQLDEDLYFSLDYELWLRFARAGAQLKVLGVPLAQYRMHPAQKTFYAEKFRPELRKVREKFLGAGQLAGTAPAPAAWKQHLRIVLVNDVGFRYGAGIAHQRLARALAAAGHELLPLAAAGEQIWDAEKAAQLATRLLKSVARLKPDLVLLGNIHGSRFDASFIEAIAQKWPTVYVAHDTWILTGRCAYTGACRKYLSGCDESCPTPQEYPQLPPPEIRPAWAAKQGLFELENAPVLATNSHWLRAKGEAVLQAMRDANRPPRALIRTIRYGLPLDTFKPRDPAVCRELLGLPQDKFLLFFCCTHVTDSRKGIGHLVEALLRLRLPDLVPVCLGAGAAHLKNQLPGLIGMEYSTDQLRQAMLYSACDVFVGPSLEEAFGQVFIEAAACATPSIAYAVDGVPESIADAVSGTLVARPTPADLATAISRLYHDPDLRRNLGTWGSIWVRLNFSFEASYHTLFHAMRAALAARGVQLSANLCFPPHPAELPDVKFLITPKPEPTLFQRQLEDYYQQRLEAAREGPLPWVLNPRAWLARINRNHLRKHGLGPHSPTSL